MISYLLIVAIGLLIFHWKIRYSESAKMVDRIPGPTALPLLGNLLMFNVTLDKMWSTTLEVLDQYYPIARIWFFKSAAIFLRHPDDLKILLSCKKNINKANITYDNFRFIKNDGLIVSGGDKWRARRKLLVPAFNPRQLRAYTQIGDEHTRRFIEDLRAEGSETIVDLLPTLAKLSLGIIAEAAMGVDLSKFSEDSVEACRQTFHLVCEVAFYRSTRPYIQDWMMRFLSLGRRQARALKTLRDIIGKLVEERKNYHKQNGYETLRNLNSDHDDNDALEGRPKKRLAVLDVLLAAELDGLIDEQGIREEIETVLAAGHDTTSGAVAFSLMLLAENQEAQERVRDEIVDVVKRNHGKLANDEIQRLDYLDRCVKEVLRMFPSAPVIARMITDDLRLKNYTVPAGHEAFVNFYALHRDPNFWPEPDKFDPDRFLPENSVGRHPFSYLPFSAGPRTCNGQKLGLMELKTMLAHLLANFCVEVVDRTVDLKFQMHVTMKPTKPIRVKLVRID